MPAEDQRKTEYPFTVAYANHFDKVEDVPFAVATALGLPSHRLTPQRVRTAILANDLRNNIFNPYLDHSSFNSAVDISKDAPGVSLVLLSGRVGLMPFTKVAPFPYIAYFTYEFPHGPTMSSRLRLDILRDGLFTIGLSAVGDPLSFRRGPIYLPFPPKINQYVPHPISKEEAEHTAEVLKENIPELPLELDRYRGIKLCSEIREKLEELGQGLTDSQLDTSSKRRLGIGGNNPPEPIIDDFRSLLSGQFGGLSASPHLAITAGLDAVDSAEKALRKTKPDAKELSKVREMLNTGAKLFSSGFLPTLGGAAGYLLTENGTILWAEVGNLCLKLVDIIESILKAV
jgi:hypothetical protein